MNINKPLLKKLLPVVKERVELYKNESARAMAIGLKNEGWNYSFHSLRLHIGYILKVYCLKEVKLGRNKTDNKVLQEKLIDQNHSQWEEANNEASFSFKGNAKIETLDDAIKFSGADITIWEVDRWLFNKWEVGAKDDKGKIITTPLIQVKVWFKKKVNTSTQTIIEKLEEHFKNYKFKPSLKYNRPIQQKNAAIINIFDAHIDKLTLLSETNSNSSIEENISNFESSFDNLLSSCLTYRPEIILFPVGNDFFNTNGVANTTKKGTPQDVMMKSEESFVIGLDVLRRCIDKASRYANVVVHVIKDNHAEDKDFYLGVALKMAYENNKNVTIENTRHQRKYFQYGENLFGFAHGDKEKNKVTQLPLIMAEEVKHLWAKTKYREFYLGDIHHREEFKFLRAKDYPGVCVRFLRSISNSDKWHTDEGYVGVPKSAEAFVWAHKGGLIGSFQVNI